MESSVLSGLSGPSVLPSVRNREAATQVAASGLRAKTPLLIVVALVLPLLCLGCSHSETANTAPVDATTAQTSQTQQVEAIKNNPNMPDAAKQQALSALAQNRMQGAGAAAQPGH